MIEKCKKQQKKSEHKQKEVSYKFHLKIKEALHI